MSEHLFGYGLGRVSAREARRIERALNRAGLPVAFTSPTIPGRGPCYWFAAPNRGEPFDRKMEAAVLAAIGQVRTSAL